MENKKIPVPAGEISRTWLKPLTGFFATGVLLYLGLLACKLTNQFDGMWWVGGYFQAGKEEISLGRWLNVVIDWLENCQTDDPYSSYLSLGLLSAANVLLVDIFSLLSRKRVYLINALLLSGTTVCMWLSYRFMSSNYALGYLFSVSAAWLAVKVEKFLPAVLLSAAAICCSLGDYQAIIGCACLLMVAGFLVYCHESQTVKEQLTYIVRCAFSLAAGCLFYKIVWDVILKLTHISAGGYGGADQISLKSILAYAPVHIEYTYWAFYKYFLTDGIHYSALQGTPLLRPLLAFIMLAVLWKGLPLLRKNIVTAVLYYGAVACLPIAVDFCCILSGDTNLKPQMTAPFMMFLPVMLCVIFRLRDVTPKTGGIIDKAALAVAAVFLWGNIYAIGTDMQVMYQGRESSKAVVSRVVNELIDEGLYDPEESYVFIGTPSENPLFYKSLLWDKANHYAQYGDFWTPSDTIRRSYEGLMIEMGLDLKIGNNEQIEKYNAADYKDPAPLFPAEGSIQKMEDCVVIKVSENYMSYCE